MDDNLYAMALAEMSMSTKTAISSKDAGIATWSNAWSLLVEFIGRAILIAKEFQGLDGEALREKVILAAERFYEEIIVPIDIPGVPNIIEPLVDKAIGKALRPLIAGAVDGLLKLFATFGWAAADAPETASS